jgi:hypothetical protein
MHRPLGAQYNSRFIDLFIVVTSDRYEQMVIEPDLDIEPVFGQSGNRTSPE